MEEAEVVGLAHGGDVFKSCYSKYGRSPYWTEMDNERTLQRPRERNGLKSFVEEPESLTLEADVTISSVPREDHGPPRSLASHTSSDSVASLMSLVDVSRVNGNNSDTSDSSDHDSLGAMRDGRSNIDKEAEMNTADHSSIQGAWPKTDEAGRNSLTSEGTENSSDFVSADDPLSGQNDNRHIIQKDIMSSDEAVEKDFSLSVFSLKFRHIRRPVSPTDRVRTDLHYSSSTSSGDTPKSKTLVQEYISHHSSSGGGTDSRSNSPRGENVLDGTLYCAIPCQSTLSGSPEVSQHVEELKYQKSSNSDVEVWSQPVNI